MLKSILFGLGMFFLLAYPTYLIYEQENILASGTIYKFPLAPVDPYDAFRGKYLALSYHFSDINTTENFKEGDATISAKHCNFFVNNGRAKSSDIEKLINRVKNQVADKTGVNLELEIKIIGE